MYTYNIFTYSYPSKFCVALKNIGKCSFLQYYDNLSCFLSGLVLIAGTYIKFKIIQYLQRRSIRTNIVIHVDDLILFEQKVNLINGPLILLQLLRILFPFWMKDILGNIEFCTVWAAFANIAILYRAIGGLGIAGVRQVVKSILQFTFN